MTPHGAPNHAHCWLTVGLDSPNQNHCRPELDGVSFLLRKPLCQTDHRLEMADLAMKTALKKLKNSEI